MKYSFKFFLTGASLIFIFAIILLLIIANTKEYNPYFLLSPAIINYLISLISFSYLNKTIQLEKNNHFIQNVLIYTTLRLLLGIIINVVVILLWKSYAMQFVLAYFFTYFLLTFFEVYLVLSNLRADSEQEE